MGSTVVRCLKTAVDVFCHFPVVYDKMASLLLIFFILSGTKSKKVLYLSILGQDILTKAKPFEMAVEEEERSGRKERGKGLKKELNCVLCMYTTSPQEYNHYVLYTYTNIKIKLIKCLREAYQERQKMPGDIQHLIEIRKMQIIKQELSSDKMTRFFYSP